VQVCLAQAVRDRGADVWRAERQWSIPEHKIIFCYGLTEEFVQLNKLHGEKPLAPPSPPSEIDRQQAPANQADVSGRSLAANKRGR
jgi:hypothetical protein